MNKRSFISNCMVEFEKRNSFKRALFVNSDDDDEKEEGPKPKRFFSSQQEIISNKTMPINNYRQNWFSQFDNSTNILERRRQIESKDKSSKWPRRALTFTEKETNKSQESESSDSNILSEIQMNLHHRTVSLINFF